MNTRKLALLTINWPMWVVKKVDQFASYIKRDLKAKILLLLILKFLWLSSRLRSQLFVQIFIGISATS